MTKFVKLVDDYVACYSADAEIRRVKKGFIYEVEEERNEMLQKAYKLKGVGGYFHSFNFKDVPVYEAKAGRMPFVCECLQGFLRLNKNSWQLCRESSVIQNVRKMDKENFYEVITENSVYILEVV